MVKKLHYFDINGLAEGIRYILHYTKQEFEDIRYDVKNWPDEEIKKSLPYHQFPLYEEDGRKLNQSLAIARHVASGTVLMPEDRWKQALADSAVHNIYEYHSNVYPIVMEKDPVKKEELKKKLFEEKLDFYFSRFERDLKENGGYFAGQLSWAEMILVGIIECSNLFLATQVEKNYPTVIARIEEIRNSPGVKEYIASRTPYVSPF